MPLELHDTDESRLARRQDRGRRARNRRHADGRPARARVACAEAADDAGRSSSCSGNSPTSGWKVDAINAGRSPIGGVEPDLDAVVRETVAAGVLERHARLRRRLPTPTLILICVQTDKTGLGPDYGPLFEALEGPGARARRATPAGNMPVIVFESTLAPSSMAHGHPRALRQARPHRGQRRPARQQPEPRHAGPPGRARGDVRQAGRRPAPGDADAASQRIYTARS